jgi:hypothetical protein
MPKIGNGPYVSPFYNDVPGFVKTELNYRSLSYGNRIRSVAPTEKRDIGAERLLWSYGKIAWAQVFPSKGGVPLGTSTSKLMSGADGKLKLYDQRRNVPNFPLLQSLTISNEGTMGSLIKASLDFVVFPQYTAAGFSMKGIEESYFKPGKDVQVRWGWSVRGGKNEATVCSLEAIVYNFEWSVNGDLSINAKCSVVSKGSIALGISGEQNNPDAENNGVQDPLGNQVYDTDIAGVVEQDVIQFGGTKNTSVSLAAGKQASTIDGLARKPNQSPLKYRIIAIPRSLRDADPDTLSQEQKDKQEDDKEALEEANAKNAALATAAEPIAIQQTIYDESVKKLNTSGLTVEQIATFEQQRDAAYDEIYGTKTLGLFRTGGLIEKAKEQSQTEGWSFGFLTNEDEKFVAVLLQKANEIKAAKAAAAKSGGTKSTTVNTQVYNVDIPEPIAEPTYYLSLGDLVRWFNGKLQQNSGPLGSIAEIKVEGNITQYLEDVVSCTPDKVYFPDKKMGTYGIFQPFQESIAEGTNIDIGKILISTTCIAETYRGFLQENQTNITYKNITGFWDSIIKKINYASGETYQLTVRVVEPTSIGQKSSAKAILSIEDSNIPTSINVKPYPFEATIAKPILKSINISSKPPGPLAAAAFATARGTGGTQPLDVKTSTKGNVTDTNKAKTAIENIKGQLITVGVSDKFAQDLKGAYSTYKRAQSDARNAHWLNKAIYPVELSLTIDGINGFHFGNVITTNLIPSQYKSEGLVFTIVKVNHTIKDGVWETTLETKSRLAGQ